MLLGNIHIGPDEHLVVDTVVQRPVLNNQSEHEYRHTDQSELEYRHTDQSVISKIW